MAKNKRRKKKSFWKISLLIFAALILSAATFVYFQLDIGSWRSFDSETIYNMRESTLIYDNRGELITTVHGEENRTTISIYDIPDQVKNAFIAAEDVRFYDHPGLDIVRMFGALWNDIKTLSLREGASTITQQLIKLTMLTPDKTVNRKLREAVLAIQLERHFTKDAILEMYLNVVYFGRGAYGIETAANVYFDKTTKDLSIVEAAALAAAIKAPSQYAPHIKPENNQKRRNMILATMKENNFITAEQYDKATTESLTIIERKESISDFPNGWFIDQAIADAEKLLGVSSEELLSGGYRIYTTMDKALQTSAETLFADATNFQAPASDGVKPEAALTAIDIKTGAVVALIGGRDYTVRRGLNRATQTRRQPGSALKPVSVYAPAIDRFGYTPVSLINDERTDFAGYNPRNYGNKYNGIVTARTALAKSLNVPAVKILNEIGVPNSRDYMIKSGLPLSDSDANLAIALGALTDGVTPLELCAAYVPFANGGNYIEPHTISHIYSSDSNLLYSFDEPEKQVLKPESAYVMTSMLKSVISSGTGSRLSGINVPLAGKTGTVDYEGIGNRDGWMTAYTPDIAVTVWMGYDKTDATHYLDNSLTGGGLPASLAGKFISSAYEGVTQANAESLGGFRSHLLWRGDALGDFPRPKGVYELAIDRQTLENDHQVTLATGLTPKEYIMTEVFTQGSEPTKQSEYWQLPIKVTDISAGPNEEGYPVITFTAPQSLALYKIIRRGGGEELTIAEYDGAGRVMVTDWTAASETEYTYRVIPYHKELLSLGKPSEGPSSAEVRFNSVMQ